MVLGPSHACSVPVDVAGRAPLLGSGRGGSCWQQCPPPPPPSSVEGLAGVGFGCPRSTCPQGLVSWVIDPLWGQAGPQVVPTRVSLGWCRGTGASRATGQPGRRAAGIPHCFSCRRLPARFIVAWHVLGGGWRLSPSLGVTLGYCEVNVPFHAWLPPRLATATGANTSQQRCSSSETPLPNQSLPVMSLHAPTLASVPHADRSHPAGTGAARLP